MEVKELRDLIKVIHDSGDCGQTLSDVLEMANKICEQPSELEIVQKALHQEYCNVELSANGYWQLFERISNSSIGIGGDETAALLTWAKQQIGVE